MIICFEHFYRPPILDKTCHLYMTYVVQSYNRMLKDMCNQRRGYSKICLELPLKNRFNKGLNDKLVESIEECSLILLNCIKRLFV